VHFPRRAPSAGLSVELLQDPLISPHGGSSFVFAEIDDGKRAGRR
jgi:hypothetical protein